MYCPVDGKADEGRSNSYPRYKLVAGTHLGEQTEYKQAQQRTVGIRGYRIDGIDDAVIVSSLEQEDEPDEYR